MEDETFERIPWEHLSGSKPPGPPLPWRTLAYLVAGAIAVAGLTATLVSRGEALPTDYIHAAGTDEHRGRRYHDFSALGDGLAGGAGGER